MRLWVKWWVDTMVCYLIHLETHRVEYDPAEGAWICQKHGIQWRPRAPASSTRRRAAMSQRHEYISTDCADVEAMLDAAEQRVQAAEAERDALRAALDELQAASRDMRDELDEPSGRERALFVMQRFLTLCDRDYSALLRAAEGGER